MTQRRDGPLAAVTGLIHHPYEAPPGFASPQQGIFKGSTVIFPDTAAFHARDWRSKAGYTYGLQGTPTTFVLEERIAALEGGRFCVLAPSGLAAIALVDIALLEQGDEVLLPDNAYGPGKELARHELAQWGIAHRFYDPMDAAALQAMICPATRLVWLEAPGSVTMEFPDLRGLLRACRDRGVLTALDNTWGAGLAFNGFGLGANGQPLGADVVMQALTKYPSGGGDVLMGSVTTRDEALHQKLKLAHMRLGLGIGANDAELVLRSLPSIQLRYAAQDRTARELALWLQQRPEVARVLHPALPGSPGHEHWAATCRSAAGLFAITFRPPHDGVLIDRFVDALRLFRIGFSWGGPMSLVVPYRMQGMRSLPPALGGFLVRFSIGLEDVADLQGDLQQALDSAFASR